jgi:glutathione S-transferase
MRREAMSEEHSLPLLATADDAAADAALQRIIAAIERRIPARVCGYYLVGSYAAGEAIAASDLDLLLLLKTPITDVDQQHLAAVRRWWRAQQTIPLDLIVQDVPTLLRVGGVWFQTASRLLYGEDLRAQVPRKAVKEHTRDLLHGVFPLLTRVRRATPMLRLPLGFPAPDARFYGYELRYSSPTEPPQQVGTKDLLNLVLAIAAALTLQQAGHYVGSGRKRDIPSEYRRVIGDGWSDLVQASYDDCRLRWGYALPTDGNAQKRLRALCQQLLGFENHFLQHYLRFLQAELHHPDPAVVQRASVRRAQLHDTRTDAPS